MRALLLLPLLLIVLTTGCFRAPRIAPALPSPSDVTGPNGKRPKTSTEWEKAGEHHRGIALVCDKQATSARLRERQRFCYWIMGVFALLGIVAVVLALTALSSIQKRVLTIAGACFLMAGLTYFFAAVILPYLTIISWVMAIAVAVLAWSYLRGKFKTLRQVVRGVNLLKPRMGSSYKAILRGALDESSKEEVERIRADIKVLPRPLSHE